MSEDNMNDVIYSAWQAWRATLIDELESIDADALRALLRELPRIGDVCAGELHRRTFDAQQTLRRKEVTS